MLLIFFVCIFQKKKIFLNKKKKIFLIFLVDSTTMTVKINPINTRVILKKIKYFLDDSKPTIRSLACH